jgi:hypothetical protein
MNTAATNPASLEVDFEETLQETESDGSSDPKRTNALPDDWGFAIEVPQTHPVFPYYIDPAIQSQYRRFSDLQTLKDGYRPSVFITWVWVIVWIGKYLTAFTIGQPLESMLSAATLISASICFLLAVIYLWSFAFPGIFLSSTPLELLRVRNNFLRAGYISFNFSACALN